MTLTYQGSHADNFNNLVAEIPVRDDPAVNAWQTWSDALKAKYGEDALTSGAYRSRDTLQETAAKAFGPLRPTTIRVGQGL